MDMKTAVALLALSAAVLVQGSPEEACLGEGGADVDEVQLLQGRADVRAEARATSESAAIAEALALLETGRDALFSSPRGCEHETETGCPQVSCGPGMLNLSCANGDLGSGRPTCGACAADRVGYELVRIRTEEVAEELSMAGPGSAFPELFHGIFWMDQYGQANHTECDPSFEYSFGTLASPEFVLSFGDTAIYDTATECITDKLYYGGPRGGWTYHDLGGGDNAYWRSAYQTGAVFTFCRSSSDPLTLDISIKIKFDGIDRIGLALRLMQFKRLDDGYWEVPTNVLAYTMVKTCFGWDRATVVGHTQGKWLQLLRHILPSSIAKYLDLEGQTLHYPVYQVVDGHGERTEHWAAFLGWASEGSVAAGVNKDGENMLVGRPRA